MTWWVNVALVGGLEHELLGFFSSQLTNSIIFQRGRYTTNQGLYQRIFLLDLLSSLSWLGKSVRI